MISVQVQDHRFELYSQIVSDFANWIMQGWGWEDTSLEIILWPSEGMIELNKDLLDHDYDTDVISLDLSTGPIQAYVIHLGGDCIEFNARLEEVTVEEELRRCIVHGLLHMRGWSDHMEEDRIRMRSEEDHWIQMFHVERNG